MSRNKCFVCTGEIQNGISEIDNSSSEENSVLLCKILELPDLRGNETDTSTNKFGERRISFCRLCLNRILNIRDMLEELERLEKKVLDEKYSVELQLKDKDKSDGQDSSDEFRGQIVTELRAASIESMLNKIRKKRVGQRRRRPRQIRIMKSVSIPNIPSQTIQPISQDQVQTGNDTFTVHESQSQLPHQHSFLSNPQRSFMRNNDVEIHEANVTSEEPLTATANLTETSWTPYDDECDIKYEIRSDSEIITDTLPPDFEPLDFPQQDNTIGQTSTKLEVDLPHVTKFSDAQQTTSTTSEDPPSHNNFICGTCGAGFVSYNYLRIHNQVHLKDAKRKRSRANNRKSGHNPKKLIPCMRPKKCEECGKVLSSKFTWADHVMSFHRGQYKFKCTLCDYGSQKGNNFRAHVKSMHSVNTEDLKCSKCDKVFESRQFRALHICITVRCAVIQRQL